MRRAAIPAIVLPALLLLSPQAALGARPAEHVVIEIDEGPFPETVCGVPVTIHFEAKVNVLAYEDGSIKVAERGLETWTNADGDWLQIFSAGHFQVQFEGGADGLLTITEWISGVRQLRSADGITASFDRGRVGNVIVIDLNDPEDPEDDVFVSFETVFVAGPHPGETVFCAVVTDVLG